MTDMTELGERAVAAEGFRWMAGMLTLMTPDDYRARLCHELRLRQGYFAYLESSYEGDDEDFEADCGKVNKKTLLDLDDPASLGCMLALVKEKHGPYINAHYTLTGGTEGWECLFEAGLFETEAEALVAALEAPCE